MQTGTTDFLLVAVKKYSRNRKMFFKWKLQVVMTIMRSLFVMLGAFILWTVILRDLMKFGHVTRMGQMIQCIKIFYFRKGRGRLADQA